MDDPQRIILDISSDEDVGWGECGVTFGGGGGGARDDGDWLSEVLDEVVRNTDDSDEVVLVGEVIANPGQTVAKSTAKCVDDDECVILDGDPDKPITVENEGEDNSDDLLVVSEKGQVACRDYPHSRHLCVKFPFNLTPHERHCAQCHCYVCDSLAPCVFWGTGISSIDHCHATDKDEFWIAQRKISKRSEKASPLVSGVPDNPQSIGLTPSSQFPSLLNNSWQQNQRLISSTATSIGIPSVVRCDRSQLFHYDQRNKFQPHMVSQQLQSTHWNSVPRMRKHSVPAVGTRSVSQRVSFKRMGRGGSVLTTNSFSNNSHRNNDGCQFSGNQSLLSECQDPKANVTPASNICHGSHQSNCYGTAADSESNLSTQPSMGSGLVNCTAAQPQIASRTYGNSVNALVPQPQISSQMHLGSNVANLGVGTQQKWGNPFSNVMLFQSQATLHVNSLFQEPVHSQPPVSSFGNFNNSSESSLPSLPDSSSCQFQVYGQPPSASNDGQSRFGQGNQGLSAPPSADFDSNLDSQPLSVEQTQLQSLILSDESAITTDSQSQHSSSPALLDFGPWVLEDVSALNTLGIPLSPGLGAYSSECASGDAGLLFDF